MSSGKNILIVDDSDFDRSLLAKALARKGGFNLTEANSGERCLELLSESHQIDLILMDVMMPGKFGTQILQSIREKHNPIELPIIMITAKTDVSDVVTALHLGANDYITKPVNFEIAISRIGTHLRIAEASREMARLQEVAAMHAMISTYNHEINNPLTIALGGLKKFAANRNDDVALKKTEEALWRVADIVKKISELSEKHNVSYTTYAGSSKMMKVR